MSTGGDRDLVRFEANERVDLPDLKALQDNARSETRMHTHTLVTGQGDNYWKDFAVAYGGYGGDRFVLKHWPVGLAGTAVTVTAGLAVGSLADAAAQSEHGIWFGGDGDSTQTIDVGSYADGVYFIKVKPVYDAAIPGTRVFWDGTNATEAANSMDTRAVFGWTLTIELLSSGDDGTSVVVGVTQVASGAIVTAHEYNLPLFEPGYSRNLLSSTTFTFPEWFKAVADADATIRDGAQAHANPIVSLIDWTAFIRGQVSMIIADGGYWRQGLPVTTTDNLGSVGDKVSLTKCRDHIDDFTDPHGEMTLTGTTTIATANVTNLNGDTTVVNSSFTANALATFGSASTVTLRNGFTLPNAGGLISDPSQLPRFSADSDDSDAYRTSRFIAGTEFQTDGTDNESIRRHSMRIAGYTSTTGTDSYIFYRDFAHYWASSGLLLGAGPYLRQLALYLIPPDDIAAHGGIGAIGSATGVATWTLIKHSSGSYAGSNVASGTITKADCAWTGDTDIGTVNCDITAVSEANRTMTLGQHLILQVVMSNRLDGATSLYSAGLQGTLATFSESCLHP